MKDLRKELALLRYSTGPTTLANMEPVKISEEQAADLLRAWKAAAPHIVTLADVNEPSIELITPWMELTPELCAGELKGREVLAANFNPDSTNYQRKILGEVIHEGTLPMFADEPETHRFLCVNNGSDFLYVTHYMDLKPYDL